MSRSVIYNYSDFHFFVKPIPQNYRLYLLADVNNTIPGDQLNSTTFGRCKVGRPPNNASAPGVDGLLSATDIELANWLQANEERMESWEEREDTFDKDNTLCNQNAMMASRVMHLCDWGPREYSNYSF